ncbi:MAG: hypothetical protein FJ161_05240, partial [Gammaproteobacteria bacterium]|nr:hypothetical protein [Gammaproteobacteria bacterium]
MQFIGRYLIKHYTELTRILKSKDSIFTKTVKIVAYVTPSLVAKFYRAITPGWVYSFSNYIGKVYTSIYSRISFISYKASSYAIVQLTTNRLRNSYKLFAKKYASDLIKQKNSHIDKMNMLNSKLRAQITTLRILSGDAGERITNLILNAAQLTLGPNVIKFFLGTGSVRKLFVTPTHTTLQAYASVAMSFLIMGISAFFSKKFMFSDLISYPANLGNIFINSILMLSVIKSAPYIIYKFIKKYASSSVAEMLVNASSSPILLGTSLSNIFFIIANLSVIISAFFMIHNISKEEASIYNQASNAPTFYDLMFTITHDIHHIQMLGVVLMWTLGPQYAVLIAGTSII